MTANELLTKVRELKGLQQMADELPTEIESLKDELKAEMTAEGKDEMTVDVLHSVTSRYRQAASIARHLRHSTTTCTQPTQRLQQASVLQSANINNKHQQHNKGS